MQEAGRNDDELSCLDMMLAAVDMECELPLVHAEDFEAAVPMERHIAGDFDVRRVKTHAERQIREHIFVIVTLHGIASPPKMTILT